MVIKELAPVMCAHARVLAFADDEEITEDEEELTDKDLEDEDLDEDLKDDDPEKGKPEDEDGLI